MYLTLLALFACNTEAPPPPPPPPPAPEVPAVPASVTRAVELAKAIQADPEHADTVLAAKGSSPAELDALMYEIAADPALTEAYAKALGR